MRARGRGGVGRESRAHARGSRGSWGGARCELVEDVNGGGVGCESRARKTGAGEKKEADPRICIGRRGDAGCVEVCRPSDANRTVAETVRAGEWAG